MKLWKLLLLSSALSTSISALAASSAGGIDRGNGGDEYSQEFVAIGYELVESLMKEPLAGVDAKALLQAVEGTKVISTSQRLILRGQEVSAINDPMASPPTILLNQSAWKRMEQEKHKQVFLAFHEYLGILGINDSNYQVSLRLDRAKVCERHSAVRSEIERELKKSCYRIIPDDLKFVNSIGLDGTEITEVSNRDFARLNLESLRLMKTNLRMVDLSTISRMNKLQTLFLGSSVSDLSDCSFLAQKPNLHMLWLSDSGYDREANIYRPIRKVAPGCFSKMGAKLKNGLMISLDGISSQYKNFLAGYSAEGGILVDGINIDKIPPEEFIAIRGKHLNLVAYDGSISENYLAQVSVKIGHKCAFDLHWEKARPGTRMANCSPN